MDHTANGLAGSSEHMEEDRMARFISMGLALGLTIFMWLTVIVSWMVHQYRCTPEPPEQSPSRWMTETRPPLAAVIRRHSRLQLPDVPPRLSSDVDVKVPKPTTSSSCGQGHPQTYLPTGKAMPTQKMMATPPLSNSSVAAHTSMSLMALRNSARFNQPRSSLPVAFSTSDEMAVILSIARQKGQSATLSDTLSEEQKRSFRHLAGFQKGTARQDDGY